MRRREDDSLTVKEFLEKTCQREEMRINKHAERRIEEFKKEAAQARALLEQALADMDE